MTEYVIPDNGCPKVALSTLEKYQALATELVIEED